VKYANLPSENVWMRVFDQEDLTELGHISVDYARLLRQNAWEVNVFKPPKIKQPNEILKFQDLCVQRVLLRLNEIVEPYDTGRSKATKVLFVNTKEASQLAFVKHFRPSKAYKKLYPDSMSELWEYKR